MDLSSYLLANSLTKLGDGNCHADTKVKLNNDAIAALKKNPKIIFENAKVSEFVLRVKSTL